MKRHAACPGMGISVLALALVLELPPTPATAQQQSAVGKTAAVNQDAKVEGRVLEIGAEALHKQRITTDARGAVQLLFIDRTTLSIGPNAIVIDEYVFDPNKKVGQMTVSLGKGLMRFVGGQITHSGTATVKTPPATIGIRGGMVDIKLEGRNVSASNAFGVVTLRPTSGPGVGQAFNIPSGSHRHVRRRNAADRHGDDPAADERQHPVLQSKPGQTGGAAAGTTNNASTASSRNTSTTVSITPRSAPAPGSTAPGPVPVLPATGTPSGTGFAGTAPSGTGTTTAATGGGSIFNNPAASVFSASGLPTTVTTSTTSVQTSSSTTAAQQARLPPNPLSLQRHPHRRHRPLHHRRHRRGRPARRHACKDDVGVRVNRSHCGNFHIRK